VQVQLTFADQASEDSHGSASTPNDSTRRGDAAGAERSHDFSTNMQIQVVLEDPLGGMLQEFSPNADGQVRMTVCKNGIYRLRVTGPTIEEAVLDDLEPNRGDKLVTVVLHRKSTKAEQASRRATISARGLRVPGKAQKELERGDVALQQGKLEDARKHYIKAIEIYANFEEAEDELGVVLMREGKRMEGKAAFERALAMNDRFAPACVNLAKIAIDDRRFGDAYIFAKRALTTEPLNPGGLFVAAEAAFFTKEYRETVIYTRSLHSLPHKPYALAHLLAAKSLEAQNQPDAAISEYQIFLNEDPEDPNAERARDRLRLLQLAQAAAANSVSQ
jgi:tetratricopeptide (TPR) repeat protein